MTMVVKCRRTRLTVEEVDQFLGSTSVAPQDFHLTEGKEYIVYGLNFAVRSNLQGTGVWVHILSDHGHLTWAPLALFEITDPGASRYWEGRVHDNGLFTLWPPLFYRSYFHEDLAEGDPLAMAEFSTLRSLMEQEAAGTST